jgi:hypothetical protein
VDAAASTEVDAAASAHVHAAASAPGAMTSAAPAEAARHRVGRNRDRDHRGGDCGNPSFDLGHGTLPTAVGRWSLRIWSRSPRSEVASRFPH